MISSSELKLDMLSFNLYMLICISTVILNYCETQTAHVFGIFDTLMLVGQWR